MKDKARYYLMNARTVRKHAVYYNKKNNYDHLAAELIRNTHSIEKGLSISNIRLGFGHAKQKEMMDIIEKLKGIKNDYYDEAIKMAVTALDEYVSYHDKMKYSDDFIKDIKSFLKTNKKYIVKSYGGTVKLDCKELKFDEKEIERFFKTRHSIREFSGKPVEREKIKKAVDLARRCPSACNRQGVRAYVVDKNKSAKLLAQLSGVGGFADSLDKLIIITGKISAYRSSEINQYLVSASIFAGYLSLTLHLYGLGACVIQRPVVYSKESEALKEELGIPKDEQLVCIIGVGNISGVINVPVSHRIKLDEVLKFI